MSCTIRRGDDGGCRKHARDETVWIVLGLHTVSAELQKRFCS